MATRPKKSRKAAEDKSIPWAAPELVPVLRRELGQCAATWSATADFAPERPDAETVLAVARVLTALTEAIDREDRAALDDLAKVARLYLRSVTVRHDFVDKDGKVVESIGRDVVRQDLHEQLEELAQAMEAWVTKGVSSDDIATHFLWRLGIHGEPLTRRLAQLGIAVRDREGAGLRRDVHDRVRGAVATELARLDGSRTVVLGERLVEKGLGAIGFPNARHLFSFKAKKTARRAARTKN